MFVYDPASDLFIYNENPDSLPEVWHSVIPTNDVSVFTKFFEKLKEYDAAPTKYAKPKIWIEDFPFLKKSYTQESVDGYINTLLFGEAQ
ncbi:MAG: hypothetical protein H6765_04165 [Candidatus Peribacteria bacterium]|nr:MAG: hypothetical protein H6765_04165 [Candidatus Peribacteria bacterium]